MAKAIIARRNGDSYQARKFWLHLLDLRLSDYVQAVSFEAPEVSFVDDLVVTYSTPIRDQCNGVYVATDYYQCKYHMVASNAISTINLIDPIYNNSKDSLLKRFYLAYVKLKSLGGGFRLYLFSNIVWHPDDETAKHISEERIRDTFYLGGEKSKLGKIRRMLSDHLSISDDELRPFISTLRFQLGKTLTDLNSDLNIRLKMAGLKSLDPTTSQNIYDDLIWKLFTQGQNRFDHKSFEEMVKEERLLVETHTKPSEISIGSMLQEFRRPYDLQSRHLNLTPFFEGRILKPAYNWNIEIAREIYTFLNDEDLLKLTQPVFLFFDCHLSIAFLAGNLINPKGNLRTIPVQKMRSSGFDIWAEPNSNNHGFWKMDGNTASEMAVVISISNPIEKNVQDYLLVSGSAKMPLLQFRPKKGVGQKAISDGASAWQMGYELNYLLRSLPITLKTIHIFYSGPVALAYIIGNTLRYVAEEIQLYEFDFEGKSGRRTYFPSIKIPVI